MMTGTKKCTSMHTGILCMQADADKFSQKKLPVTPTSKCAVKSVGKEDRM